LTALGSRSAAPTVLSRILGSCPPIESEVIATCRDYTQWNINVVCGMKTISIPTLYTDLYSLKTNSKLMAFMDIPGGYLQGFNRRFAVRGDVVRDGHGGMVADPAAERAVEKGRNDQIWELWFSRFLDYPLDHQNRRDLPQNYVSGDGHRLGLWQHAQRMSYRKGTLKKSRVTRLEKAGFVWDPRELSWQVCYEHFLTVPPNGVGKRVVAQLFRTADGFRLGKWLDAQRSLLKKGTLDPERFELLQKAGMMFDPVEESWETGLHYFQAFKADAHGRRIVPQTYVTDDGFRLGWWQQIQRRSYYAEPRQLSELRIALLEANGIIWDPKQLLWEEAFHCFQKFPRDAKGNRLVPQSYVDEDGFKLGVWVSTQRVAKKKYKMRPERIAQLEAAGMVWSLQSGHAFGSPPSRAYTRQRQGISRTRQQQQQRRSLTCTPQSRGAENKRQYDTERRLQAMGGAVPPQVEPPQDEHAWQDEWRQRLGCWWLGLSAPIQTDLVHCLGALSLHLTSRMNRLLGRTPTQAAGGGAGAEPGCEWVTEELQLPDFPSLNGFEFSVPPIPRLLPSWQQLQLHSYMDGRTAEPQLVARTSLGSLALAMGSSGIGTFSFATACIALVLRRRSK